MGWAWPPLRPALPMAHGPLIVGGFLGALISLERAVALGQLLGGRARLLVLIPLRCGLGGALVLLGAGGWVGPLLICLGSAGLAGMMLRIYRMQPALHAAILFLGAVVWLAGNVLWLAGRSVPEVVWWWLGFLVLTIAAERLELSRLLRLSRQAQALFVAAVVLLVAGLIVSVLYYAVGVRVVGASLIGLSAWLLRYDIAWRRLRAGGQARFIGVSLLAGYAWLGVGGILALWQGGVTAGLLYDAMLHAVFLGFVFSMVFAHALIIFPALLGRPLGFRPSFYVHLTLLHLSVALRIVADIAGMITLRRWAGLLNAIAILLFLANTLIAARRSRGG